MVMRNFMVPQLAKFYGATAALSYSQYIVINGIVVSGLCCNASSLHLSDIRRARTVFMAKFLVCFHCEFMNSLHGLSPNLHA